MPEEVLYDVAESVATITLNRPHRRNAISVQLLSELTECLLSADRDRAVRAVVLTGAGKGFCAGLDIKDALAGTGIGSSTSGAASVSTRDLPTTVLFEMDKPIVCALNGAAAGYGVDLALGCDIRLAGRSSRLLPGFAKRGVVPESGGTWYLPRLIGWAKAAEVAFLGRDLDADRCLELGLVNAIVDDDDLLPEAHRWAAEIAANAPLAVQGMKRLFRHGLTEDFPSHTHHVLLETMHLFRSKDFAEGIRSFAEGRDPSFEGR